MHVHTWKQTTNTCSIFALHGFTGSGLDFEPLARKTANKCNWICPDFLGHGQSQSPPNDIDYSLAKMLLRLDSIYKSNQTQKNIMLGYSMGGRILLHYVKQNPGCCAALILVGVSPGIADLTLKKTRQLADEQLAKKIECIKTKKFIDAWQQSPLIKTQQTIETTIYQEMLKRRYACSELGLANTLKQLGTGKLPSLWSDLHAMAVPTIFISGAGDLKFKEISSRASRLMPRAQHIEIPNAGHAAHLENRDSFMQVLSTYLK